MKSFLAGVVLTLAIGTPIAVLWWREVSRRLRDARPRPADIDQELARLTGELAHEIRNPLSTVKVNLKLTREALEEIDPSATGSQASERCTQALASALRKITVIQKETDRLDQVVEKFLRYVRRAELELATVDLNELVGDMIDFYWPQAHSHALTLRHSLAERPLMVRVDPGALKQVLLNLFLNAQQAMDKTGELMVRTSRRGCCGVLEVSDTGCGIAPERLSTIFRPYHSSRSGGTGLGLATAKKIVDAHQGTIAVHSELGKGTAFTIKLPLVDGGSDTNEVDA